MLTVNVHDAKTHFSRLLKRIEHGEEVMIARAGKPVARLVPVCEPRLEIGFADLGEIPDDVFFTPLSESELADWE